MKGGIEVKNLMDAKGLDLYWEQPNALQTRFILVAGEDIYAKLDFHSGFSTSAEAAISEDRWTITRMGLFSTQVTVRRVGSEVELATFYPRWTGTEGKILFATGEQYHWRVANFWASKYLVSSENGLELITYISGSREKKFSNIFKQQARVIIAPEAWQLKDLPMLVFWGWYLVILHIEESSAVAVTTSVAVLN